MVPLKVGFCLAERICPRRTVSDRRPARNAGRRYRPRPGRPRRPRPGPGCSVYSRVLLLLLRRLQFNAKLRILRAHASQGSVHAKTPSALLDVKGSSSPVQLHAPCETSESAVAARPRWRGPVRRRAVRQADDGRILSHDLDPQIVGNLDDLDAVDRNPPREDGPGARLAIGRSRSRIGRRW